MKKSKNIVLIHGNFVNEKTWSLWKQRYEARGYKIYAPSNPGHNGDPLQLRRTVHPELVKTGFKTIVGNIEKLIDGMPDKPLVIGHSMAGMAAMKLLEFGKVSAAVSIDGAPPKNVFPPLQTLKTVLPAFGFFTFKRFFMGSRKWYAKSFFNTIPETEQHKAFEKFAVPESFKVSRELVLDSYSNIDFEKRHAPILFVGGGRDHIFPKELTKKIAAKYKPEAGTADVKIFDERSHFTCGEPGWEKVADYVLDWYENL